MNQVMLLVVQTSVLTMTLHNSEQFVELQVGSFCLTTHAVVLG